MTEPLRIPMLASGVDAMFDRCYAWVDGELGRRTLRVRRRYVRDLVFLMTSLMRSELEVGDDGVCTLVFYEHWSPQWLGLLADCGYPDLESIALEAAAMGWNTERPRHWPAEVDTFVL